MCVSVLGPLDILLYFLDNNNAIKSQYCHALN